MKDKAKPAGQHKRQPQPWNDSNQIIGDDFRSGFLQWHPSRTEGDADVEDKGYQGSQTFPRRFNPIPLTANNVKDGSNDHEDPMITVK